MSASPFHILLVEDDEVDIEIVRRAFAKGKIDTPLTVASDGEAALALLRKPKVALEKLLIVLDLNLPKMTGIEFLRHLRADQSLKQLPVVVMTTSNDDRDKSDAYELFVAGYLVKPSAFARVVEMMVTLNRYWQLVELQ